MTVENDGSVGPYGTFDYIDGNHYQTQASGSDGRQLRALRVVLGEATSGSVQHPNVVLCAKDANGNEQYLLATPDVQNPGSYSLKVDSEMVISGATWIVTNILVMSEDGTSGSLHYFRCNSEGSGAVFDAPFSAATVYELQAVSGVIQKFSSSNDYDLRNISSSVTYELQAVSGVIQKFSSSNDYDLRNISSSVTYELQAVSGVIQKFSSSNDYDLRNLSSSLTYELQAVSGVIQKFSGSNDYDLRNISSSLTYELQAVSGVIQKFSGSNDYDLRNISSSLKYEAQAISGVLMLFSSSNDYDLRQISSSLTALDAALSGALIYELQAISGVIQKFSGSNSYDLKQLSSSVGIELRNISSSILDFSGAVIHELQDISASLEGALDRYHQASSYSGTTTMLLYTASLPAVDEGDAVPHRGTSDGAAAVAEQYYLNRSDEVTVHLAAHNTVSSGTVVTATAGTAVQFTTTSTDACIIYFTAYETNQTVGCVGGSGIGARRAGVPVEPGETKRFPVNNVNLLYWNANTVGDGGTWFRSYE